MGVMTEERTRLMNHDLETPSATAPSDRPEFEGLERATFAAGCSGGVEASFRELEGVVRTSVGYTGGIDRHPSYGLSAPARRGMPSPSMLVRPGDHQLLRSAQRVLVDARSDDP